VLIITKMDAENLYMSIGIAIEFVYFQ
jgi:hypothetical protein